MQLLGDARRVALGGLIDYAGLFPPTALEMTDAVAGFRAARAGDAGWIAGRFLCPTSHLEQLASALTTTMTEGETPWPVGAVFDEDIGPGASHAATFHAYADPAASVQTAEIRLGAGTAEEALKVARAAISINAGVAVFLEVAMTPSWEEQIPATVAAIAAVRSQLRRAVGAKLRCGGAETSAFPSPEQVAMFIISCERHGLPFKATAGLHHPIRHHDEELGIMRHGFLNILAAAAVAAEDAPFHDVAAAVAETDPAAFTLGAGAFRFREHAVPTRTLGAVRSGAFVAYGSCDFEEPVADLAALGML
jgi:hypothetical protein